MDDSPVALALLKRMLSTSPDIEVVGTARNGKEALAMLPQAQPKVICTDLMMPVMDGLELIREVMVAYPRPILVVSSAINPQERDKTYELLAAGAIDVFPKPSSTDGFEENARQLVQKIRILAGVFVVTRRPQEPGPLKVRPPQAKAAPNAAPLSAVTAAPSVANAPGSVFQWPSALPPRIVAIGASTGGPQVLAAILSALPGGFPWPILCVQHISKGFLGGMVEWLDSQCRLRVRIAQPGEMALPGHVYFPAEDTHLEVDGGGHLIASQAPAQDGHRPSVTATFRSVARHYGQGALAILLTGMGSDGASGLQAVFQAGGATIAQDQASCVVFGMPRVAIEMGAARCALPPHEIAQALVRLAEKHNCR